MRRQLRPHQYAVLGGCRDGRVARVNYDYLWAKVGSGFHTANVSQTVYSLEDAGLVVLHRDGSIELTELGAEVLRRTDPVEQAV